MFIWISRMKIEELEKAVSTFRRVKRERDYYKKCTEELQKNLLDYIHEEGTRAEAEGDDKLRRAQMEAARWKAIANGIDAERRKLIAERDELKAIVEGMEAQAG